MKLSKSYIFSFSLILSFLFSCTTEGEDIKKSKSTGLYLYADIEGFNEGGSRATPANNDDHWTLRNFSYGDLIGLYSAYGDNTAEDGNGPLNNVPMEYGQNSFVNYDIDCNMENFKDKMFFYYYPYCEHIDYDKNITSVTHDPDYGIKLRVPCADGIERCNDILFVVDQEISSQYNFKHAMSSIVILRGEGFENPKNDSVTVVLTEGFSHFTLQDNPYKDHTYYKTGKLVYLEDCGKTELECRKWEAWPGDDYTVKNSKDPYDTQVFKNVYYVVLPTMNSSGRTTVNHIRINDNNGKWHNVSNFYLISGNRKLEPGARYPLLIKMEGIEPVGYPYEIIPWEGDNVIKDDRDAGINTYQEFIDWMSKYSLYINPQNPVDEALINQLLEFGDKTELPDGTLNWTFYINNDIDFSGHDFDAYKTIYLLNFDFKDRLEGRRKYTLSNIKISNGNSPSFLKSLTKDGVLKNLNFEGIWIEYTGDEEQTVGGLVQDCYGTISNCDVSGTVISNGPVGMIAGNAQNATVENCILSGNILGKSTVNNLFGTSTGNCTLTGNHTSDLRFLKNQ